MAPILSSVPIVRVQFIRTVNNKTVAPNQVTATPTVPYLTVAGQHGFIDPLQQETSQVDSANVGYLDLVATDDTDVTEAFGWTIAFAGSTRPTRTVSVPQSGGAVRTITTDDGVTMPAIWLSELADFSGASGPVGSTLATQSYVTGAISALQGTSDPFPQYAVDAQAVPAGGSTGQALIKTGNADYAIGWSGGLSALTALRKDVAGRPVRFNNKSTWVAEDPSFWVKGINMTHLGGSFLEGWTTAWDLDWHKDCVDKIVALGSNTTRIIGNGRAYSQNPTLYKQRFTAIMNYIRDAGLKTIYSFITVGDGPDDVGMSWASRYDTMIPDLMAPYVGAGFILGWDVGNELRCDNNSDHVAAASRIANLVRTTDASAKVCSSMGAPLIEHAAATDSFVDFHDIHTYENPSREAFNPQKFDVVRATTDKPILFGEFGANVNPDGAGDSNGGPHMTDEYARSHLIRAMMRYAVGGDLMGVMMWTIKDVGNNKFGLYHADNTPTPMIQEWVKYPAERLDAAKAYVDHRFTPVVYDNFTRADTTNAIGAPPLGPTPSAISGTWGIQGGGAYVSADVSDYPGSNILLWDSRMADFSAEVEWSAPAGQAMVGLVFRYQDAQNFWLWYYKSQDGGVRLTRFTGGNPVELTPAYPWAPDGAGEGPPMPAVFPYWGRLRVTCIGSSIHLYDYDRKVRKSAGTLGQTATRHGILLGPSSVDSGSRIRKFSVEAPLRYY